MTRLGIDYAWEHPSPAAIRAAGYTFVCRYLSRTSDKNLTASELAALVAAGIAPVLNWEAAAGAALNGRTQGITDAQQAKAQAQALGLGSAVIYFSADKDPRTFTAAQWSAIDAYYDGVASIIGKARTGGYGGYALVEHLYARGFTRLWQTYAWSDGRWSAHAQIRQVQNGITVGGADVDKDEAMVDDFGQWGYQKQEPDMEQTDLVSSPSNPKGARGNHVGDVLADLEGFRDWLYDIPGHTAVSHNPPPAGSRLDLLVKAVTATTAPVSLTDAQVQTIAADVATQLGAKLDQVLAKLNAAGKALDS